ncbi:MAG: hydrogen gas-evolving membrane-bound hydrogenase subunit E [Candidatus Eisenbacteria bacterium]
MVELLGVVVLFTIIAAIIAIEIRDLLAVVVSITAVGFGLIIAFFFMLAPDVAIVPIVVEVLTLIILIRATLRVGLKSFAGNRDFFGLMVTMTLLFVVFLASMRVFQGLPEFGHPVFSVIPNTPSMYYVMNGVNDTGAANIVSAVILDYRAYDTLGEATVLFTAVMGAIAIIRKRARKASSEPEELEWQE